MKNKIILLLLSISWLAISGIVAIAQPAPAQTNTDTENENKDEDEIPTRSYVGLGGNIGISGEETVLGDGGFSLVGRAAFTQNISLHTSTVFGDDNVGTFALTFGIPIYKSSASKLEMIYPFVGGGIAVEDFFGDFEVDGLVTTGLDVPILERVTGTVRLNLGFAEDDTDVGLLLGVGYNFSIFELL